MEDENLTIFSFHVFSYLGKLQITLWENQFPYAHPSLRFHIICFISYFLRYVKANPRHVILPQSILVFVPKKCIFVLPKCHHTKNKPLPLPQIKFGFCGFISLELSHMGDGVLLSPLMSDLMLNTCVLLRVSRMEMPCGYPEQHIVVPFVTGRNSV